MYKSCIISIASYDNNVWNANGNTNHDTIYGSSCDTAHNINCNASYNISYNTSC